MQAKLQWGQRLSPQLVGVMTNSHHVSRTKSQRLSCPELLENQDFFQCQGRMRAQGSDFPSAPGTEVPKLAVAECRQLLVFLGVPGSSPLLQQISALSMDSGQTTCMLQILRLLVEAYCIFASHFTPCWSTEFVSEQAAQPVTPTASVPGTLCPQLLQNYPTVTLQSPTDLPHSLCLRRKQSHSPPKTYL